MRAKIIMEFTMDNVIDQESLDDMYGGSMEKCVRALFKDDHFIGMVNEKYRILKVTTLRARTPTPNDQPGDKNG